MIEESLDYVECPYDAEVNVLLTDNAGIHQINLDMRGIDNPTDVLSFLMCDFETPGTFPTSRTHRRNILTRIQGITHGGYRNFR